MSYLEEFPDEIVDAWAAFKARPDDVHTARTNQYRRDDGRLIPAVHVYEKTPDADFGEIVDEYGLIEVDGFDDRRTFVLPRFLPNGGDA